jgi:hypothetical protein
LPKGAHRQELIVFVNITAEYFVLRADRKRRTNFKHWCLYAALSGECRQFEPGHFIGRSHKVLKVRLRKDLRCESSNGRDNVVKLLAGGLGSNRKEPNHL